MTKFKDYEYLNKKDILAIPDHYVNIARLIKSDSSLAVEENGRKIVKAGTIFPANNETAIGLVFQDYDVTDGDVAAAILVHGFVLADKLPKAPEDEALGAMKMVSVIKNIEKITG